MRPILRRLLPFTALALATVASTLAADAPGQVKGSFVVGGTDAKLIHVRAKRVALDKGAKGYAVLLSARPADGEILAWKTADPAEKGSYLHVIFDAKGGVWVADLGHEAAKSGHFGVVTEIETASFAVDGDRLKAHIRTNGEQVFTQDHYSVDLTFDVTLE